MKFIVDAIVRDHAIIMLLVMLVAFVTARPEYLAAAGPLLFARLIAARHDAWKKKGFGPANTVTVIRLFMVVVLGLLPSTSGITVAAITIVVFALDGLDGWLARRFDHASSFGAALDMEVDAFLIAMLSTCLWRNEVAGWWIFIPGGLRYVFVLGVAVREEPEERPRSRLTRYAFSVLVCSLAIAFLPLGRLATIAAAVGTLVVCGSFGHSLLDMIKPASSFPKR